MLLACAWAQPPAARHTVAGAAPRSQATAPAQAPAAPSQSAQAPAGTPQTGASAGAQAAAAPGPPPPPPLPGFYGKVDFNGVGVPGAIVTATPQAAGAKPQTTITAPDGTFDFPAITSGDWTLSVQMTGFAPLSHPATVTANAPGPTLDLTLLPYSGPPAVPTVAAAPTTGAAPATKGATTTKPKSSGFQQANLSSTGAAPPPSSTSGENAAAAAFNGGNPNATAADALSVNASMNNGAASPFAQSMAFGNNRNGRSLYNGTLGFILDTSAFDAAPYSVVGVTTKPNYLDTTILGNIGGPLRIPGLWSLRSAPQFFINFAVLDGRNDNIGTGLVPTAAERSGNLSDFAGAITNPATGQPFAGNQVPVSAQAAALLALYPLPLPGLAANPEYNYQASEVKITHQDSLRLQISKNTRLLNFNNALSLQSTRSSAPNLFDFLDSTDTLGWTDVITARHFFTSRFNIGVQDNFARFTTRINPYFANQTNVSGNAGITGNNQAPEYWGPPSLSFSSGLASLSDGNPENNRTQTNAVSPSAYWNHGRHNIQFGADLRRLQYNYLQQTNPRGSFDFNGAATGDPFADFLLGIPDTSSIAYGNADKYFRESTYDAYFDDDFRLNSEVTLDLGVRWEYSAPITELYGRLVNLDIAPGFTAETPVLASDPVGATTGTTYPSSLVRPDKRMFEPRLGLAWRPFAASSLVVHGSYGVYANTSIYQNLAWLMSQQAPLSKSLNVSNSAATPLTLADGFINVPGITPDQFAVDPNLRVGYTQTWLVSVQRDLPAAMVGTLTYTGIKGTHAMQEFMPNTYAPGGVSPCPTCPVGYAYLTSGGDSTYEAGKAQLQRRLSGGLSATVLYTYSKAIDDASVLGGQQSGGLGTYQVAQNWLDLDAERSLSSFDQRQTLNTVVQYTTGLSVKGGALLSGWRGRAYKSWTLQAAFTAATGMPLTPLLPATLPGTGTADVLRPELTGASVYAAPAGLHLNPAAYTTPAAGLFGDAPRNSIEGPGSWNLNGDMHRSFQMTDRITANFDVAATNLLNHVVFPNWNVLVGSAQFGLPQYANAMRSLQTQIRFTF